MTNENIKKGKKCRCCGKVKLLSEFVATTGNVSSRGRYCKPCHIKRIKNSYKDAIKEERAKIPKLKIIYGKYWKHYALPLDFAWSLYKERDFCPYCGELLPPQYPCGNTIEGSLRRRAQIDHMDPVSKGGEDSIRNTVYVCDKCNYEKRDSLFLDWIRKLRPKFRKLALEIYTKKHGHPPEKFKIGGHGGRVDGCLGDLLLDENSLKEIYPEPIVNEHPNKPVTIELSLAKVLDDPEIKRILKQFKNKKTKKRDVKRDIKRLKQ